MLGNIVEEVLDLEAQLEGKVQDEEFATIKDTAGTVIRKLLTLRQKRQSNLDSHAVGMNPPQQPQSSKFENVS